MPETLTEMPSIYRMDALPTCRTGCVVALKDVYMRHRRTGEMP